MRALLPLSLLVMLSGCVSAGTVTLLPGEAGAPVGAVALFDPKTQAERGVLDAENTQTGLGRAKVRPRQIKADHYAALASVMPPPAHHFVVYFLEGSTNLAPGSEPVLNQMLKEITLRSGPEVEIIGHTDTVGSDAANDELSLRRAQEIRDALVGLGRLDVSISHVSGRGERELLAPTPDNTADARNRRVEIVVR